MKVFWQDRDGVAIPANSTFFWRSFDSAAQGQSAERITELPPPKKVKVKNKVFLPEKSDWIQIVKRALKYGLQKLVLARQCILELETAPDPLSLVSGLVDCAEGAFVYCLQNKDTAFFGASPERLYRKSATHITSEAMAGTVRRGSPHDLLYCAKSKKESVPVEDYIQKALHPFCEMQFTPMQVYTTNYVQHLYSRGMGTLQKGLTDAVAIDALHPTPALCGSPKAKAFSVIRALEPFPREMYGGIIGWTSGEESEAIVAIRSCKLQGNIATLYSGVGIVPGSDPEQEWEELNDKIKLYDSIFDY